MRKKKGKILPECSFKLTAICRSISSDLDRLKLWKIVNLMGVARGSSSVEAKRVALMNVKTVKGAPNQIETRSF